MKKFILFFCALIGVSLIAFTFFYSSEGVKFNSITVEGKFSISIPEYLAKTDSIDASALLQYKNEKEQMFLLVYEKNDSSVSLQNFFKKISDAFVTGIDRGALLKYYPEKINGQDALIGNIRGSVNETGVYYKVATIGSDGCFYEIIIGISQKMQSTYDEDMDKIIRGFKILP